MIAGEVFFFFFFPQVMYVRAWQWIAADLTAAHSVTSEQLKDTDWPSHTEVIQRRLLSHRSAPEFKDSSTRAPF